MLRELPRLIQDGARRMRTLLSTRPIFHKLDEAIRGHVFCSVCTRSAPQIGRFWLKIAQAATVAVGSRFGFQFQGSKSATLLAG
jgi:hypothetical protein